MTVCGAANPGSEVWRRKGKHKKMRYIGPIRCIEPIGHAYGSDPTLHSDGSGGWHLPGEPLFEQAMATAREIELAIEAYEDEVTWI